MNPFLALIIFGALIGLGVGVFIHDGINASKEIWRDSPCSTLHDMHKTWKDVNNVTIIDFMWEKELVFRELIEERGC